jgi:hypothetical protein
MPLTAHDLSVAVFARGLTNLKATLTKGEAYASAAGIDPRELLDARLAADMYTLAVQVHWACEGAKLAVARLVGAAATPSVGEAKTFDELYEQIDRTIAHLRDVSPNDLEAGLDRTIEIEHRGSIRKQTGSQFLVELAIPSFFFHATTAYGILRHKGVDLTKGQFLGGPR